MAGPLQCYNKGCGKKFQEADNNAEACQYHSGAPIFHDADKKWSCCNKRSKDFTAFLGMPGCTVGRHNGIRPQEESKPPQPATPAPAPQRNPLPERRARPSPDAPQTALVPTVTASLKALLAKEQAESSEKHEEDIDPATGVKRGEPCKRNGCKQTYADASSSLEQCRHHPGGPVFHEGLKYWSCCGKKTTDFTEFLAQRGCTVDSHLWADQKRAEHTACRYDWHQTGAHVCVTVYAKGAVPPRCAFRLSPTRLSLALTHQRCRGFDLDLTLAGIVEPAQSSVTLAASKVEVKMKKAELVTWARLALDDAAPSQPQGNGAEEPQPDQSSANDLNIDAVDLSDL